MNESNTVTILPSIVTNLKTSSSFDYYRIVLILVYLIIVINLFFILTRLFILNCLKTDWSVINNSGGIRSIFKRKLLQRYQNRYYQDSLVAIRPDTFFKKIEKYKEDQQKVNNNSNYEEEQYDDNDAY